ncbi:cysteine-rich protein 2 isoform X2 [Choloepus didactylus]|uniref:cysteine-rich protein 2 isoform X2 n=1 Tax=Choloepus didactylus TaxID=27675 RepID=UPI00189CB082|nr:cysteine-rich protein 2 isoform X2 [Choloepus didactylus]
MSCACPLLLPYLQPLAASEVQTKAMVLQPSICLPSCQPRIAPPHQEVPWPRGSGASRGRAMPPLPGDKMWDSPIPLLLVAFQKTPVPTPLPPPAMEAAEKVSSLGKDWHKFCLKCERCNKTLTPGGHAEHDGKPFCHKPCYATLYGPKGVNIGGAGSYIYEKPPAEGPQVTGPIEVPVARAEDRKAGGAPKGPSKASSVTTFTGEPNVCPRCNERVYFAEKVTSLGKDWHRPCLRCERCGKTLTPGGHAEHDGQPYCHKPCYGILFGPKGVNTGAVGSYIYDRDPEGKAQP